MTFRTFCLCCGAVLSAYAQNFPPLISLFRAPLLLDSTCLDVSEKAQFATILDLNLTQAGFPPGNLSSVGVQVKILRSATHNCEYWLSAQTSDFSTAFHKTIKPINQSAWKALTARAGQELARRYIQAKFGRLSISCTVDSTRLRIFGMDSITCPANFERVPPGRYPITSVWHGDVIGEDTAVVSVGKNTILNISPRSAVPATRQDSGAQPLITALASCRDSLMRTARLHWDDSISCIQSGKARQDSLQASRLLSDSLTLALKKLGTSWDSAQGHWSHILSPDSHLVELGNVILRDSVGKDIQDSVVQELLRGAVRSGFSVRRTPLDSGIHTGRVLDLQLSRQQDSLVLTLRLSRTNSTADAFVLKSRLTNEDAARLAREAARKLWGPQATPTEAPSLMPFWLRLTCFAGALAAAICAVVVMR
ncbi:MAG TPA: hypothetical protein VLM37_13490 [Fibrobacteraceae bacterium]|nr:hypothetical protein [Fibrobacteraceae bacterium]